MPRPIFARPIRQDFGRMLGPLGDLAELDGQKWGGAFKLKNI